MTRCVKCIVTQKAITNYLERQRNLSAKSRKSYAFGLNMFADVIDKKPADLTHKDLTRFITHMLTAEYADSTVSMFVSAIVGFFDWMAFEKIWHGDMTEIRYVARKEKPKIIQQTPSYDPQIIVVLVEWAMQANHKDVLSKRDAFLILASLSTGGRLGKELCSLKRGKVDFQSGHALVIGKGGKEGKLRFSLAALRAGKNYLKARSDMDGKSGQPLASLPLFINHRTKTKVKALTYIGAYKALKSRAAELCGEDANGFHPHLLRHEFVSRILRETGNLKLAQELARHVNMQTTQRYAHLTDNELDQGYSQVFNKGVA